MLSLLAAVALAALPRSARSLEVSLEENRGERGSIGYVDLHRVFQRFPETHKARQSFQEIVRQAEEQVNLRKAELVALRADLSRLILERELLQKTPLAVPAPEPAKPPETVPAAPAPLEAKLAVAEPPKPEAPKPEATKPEAAQPPLPDLKLPAREEMTLPGMNKPLTINLPGLTTGPVQIEPPVQEAAKPAETPTPAEPPTPAESPKPAEPAAVPVLPPPPPQPTTADLEAAALRSRQDRLAILDAQSDAKRKEIAAKEEEALKHQEQVEKNLLELESRRSEILLGKIYTVVQEVARENGVSVVVDKGQILFGQKTVDLTEKVLKKLEGL
ncbi:MAG: OmpH family outer membrane protein [Elusimicrobiota bacterium]